MFQKKCPCGDDATRAVVYQKHGINPLTGEEGYGDELVKWLCGRCPDDIKVADGSHRIVRVAKIGDDPKTERQEAQMSEESKQELSDRVFALVDAWVHDDQRSFTAYDVTQALRAETSVRISHTEVREIVHKLFENGEMDDYTRGKKTDIYKQPWEYHPRLPMETATDLG